MTLLDRYTIKRDKYNWVLKEEYEGRKRNGEPKVSVRETYHGTLCQALQEIVDREACGEGSVEEMVGRYEEAVKRLRKSVCQFTA